MQCLWAEATRLIDVGTMAGTGKAAQVAGAHGGAQTASVGDDGAFRESLKASVGVPIAGRASMPAVMPTAAPAVEKGVVAGSVQAGGKLVQVAPVIDTGAAPVTSLEAPALKSGSEDKDVCAQVQTPARTGSAMVAGIEDAAGKKTVATAVGGKAGAEVKAGKPEPGSKKAMGVTADVSAGAGAQGAGAGEAIVSAPVTAVSTQALPVAAQEIAAGVETVQAKISTGAVSGSGEAKAAGPNRMAKGSGREAKKIDEVVPVSSKPGSGVVAATATPVAGSGAGHVAGKDGVAGVAVQGVAGAAVMAPVGMAAGHGAVAGVAGAKVAASVDAVSTPAGQGSAAGPEVKTLAATPNLLEVGIDGGTHGWLRVRAELGQTGEVTASVVAASAGQADTLRRELPAMSTYLAGESVGVSSLVVNAAGAAAGAQDAAMSLGAGAQGGGDGRAQGGVSQQSGGQGRGAGASEGGVSGLEFSGAELPAAVYANGSGSWLSVRV